MIDCVKRHPHLLFLILPFLDFLDPSELFVGLGSGPKTFLGLTYVDNQLWFFKYSSTCLFLVQQHFGPLLHFFGPFGAIFLALLGYFWRWSKVQNIFGTYLPKRSTFVLES